MDGSTYKIFRCTPHLWDPILSFSHTFSPKSTCVGGPCPTKTGPRPLREILDPLLIITCSFCEEKNTVCWNIRCIFVYQLIVYFLSWFVSLSTVRWKKNVCLEILLRDNPAHYLFTNLSIYGYESISDSFNFYFSCCVFCTKLKSPV